MNIYFKWFLYFIPNLLITILCYLFNPIAAIFTTKRERTDRVKRLDNKQVTMQRDYLIPLFYWFQTHDNAVDEYWYGLFTETSIFPFVRNATQEQYDSNWFLRYLCRLLWMYRNCAYGFSYNLFGIEIIAEDTIKEYGVKEIGFWWRYRDRKNSWQFETHIPLFKRVQIDINIGWKKHTGFPKVMYANRLISFKLIERL